MTTLAIMVFLLLAAIAVLHVAWGFGMRWPAEDEHDLVALVVGATGRSRMPAMVECLAAATAIFIAGLVALATAGLIALPVSKTLLAAVAALVAVVFAARGVAAYLPAWRRRFAQEPFATLDQSWFGPLCLLLGLAFAFLAAGRMWAHS
jgi:Protein of unknown function (DUF3995)